MVAVLEKPGRTTATAALRCLLWTVQALLGGIAGFAVGDASVVTRCTVEEPGGRATLVTVEVRVLGVCVSRETGLVATPEGGPYSIRSLSLTQAAWVYGIPIAGMAVGVLAALGSATLLVRTATRWPSI